MRCRPAPRRTPRSPAPRRPSRGRGGWPGDAAAGPLVADLRDAAAANAGRVRRCGPRPAGCLACDARPAPSRSFARVPDAARRRDGADESGVHRLATFRVSVGAVGTRRAGTSPTIGVDQSRGAVTRSARRSASGVSVTCCQGQAEHRRSEVGVAHAAGQPRGGPRSDVDQPDVAPADAGSERCSTAPGSIPRGRRGSPEVWSARRPSGTSSDRGQAATRSCRRGASRGSACRLDERTLRAVSVVKTFVHGTDLEDRERVRRPDRGRGCVAAPDRGAPCRCDRAEHLAEPGRRGRRSRRGRPATRGDVHLPMLADGCRRARCMIGA